MLSSDTGSQKLGQPEPESNFEFDEKRFSPQHTHLKEPSTKSSIVDIAFGFLNKLFGDITINGVFNNVRTSVKKSTNGNQIPVEMSKLEGGDFYFSRNKKGKYK